MFEYKVCNGIIPVIFVESFTLTNDANANILNIEICFLCDPEKFPAFTPQSFRLKFEFLAPTQT